MQRRGIISVNFTNLRERITMAKALMACLVLFISISAEAASFDCARKKSNVEYMVCSDAVLSEMDELLSATFEKLIGLVSGKRKEAAIQEQRAWMADRDAVCIDRYRCTDMYYSRLATLRRSISPLELKRAIQTYRTMNDFAWDPDFVYFLNNYFGQMKYVDDAGQNYPLRSVVGEALGGPPEPLIKERNLIIGIACAAHACNLKGMVIYDSEKQQAVFVVANAIFSGPERTVKAIIYYKDPAFEHSVDGRLRELFKKFSRASQFEAVQVP